MKLWSEFHILLTLTCLNLRTFFFTGILIWELLTKKKNSPKKILIRELDNNNIKSFLEVVSTVMLFSLWQFNYIGAIRPFLESGAIQWFVGAKNEVTNCRLSLSITSTGIYFMFGFPVTILTKLCQFGKTFLLHNSLSNFLYNFIII